MIKISDSTTKFVIEYLHDAPEHFSDTLTRLYADWCRKQPATIQTSAQLSSPLPIIPREIAEYITGFKRILQKTGRDFNRSFPFVLCSEYGIQLLWCLHETRSADSQRSLYNYLPILKPLEHIRRGGINVYKRFSWTMHVMVASRVLWSDLPRGDLPPTIEWPAATRYAMTLMKSEYEMLNENEIKLLRVACIIHDIGVKDGVEGHDKKGIPYVELAIAPLGGSQAISDLVEGMLTPSETLVALQALVGEHTLASKVNGEEGPAHIQAGLSRWLGLAPRGSNLRRFLEGSFPRLLASFLVCDIVGVADELLTAPTIKRATQAIRVLSNIVSSSEIPPPTSEECAERLGTLIGMESAGEVMTLMREMFKSDDEIAEILSNVGAAELLDYAMGILKPLRDPKIAIAILSTLVRTWADLGPVIRQRPLELKFSPHCNLDSIHNWGKALLASIATGPSKEEIQVAPSNFGVEVEIVEDQGAPAIRISTEQQQA